MMILSLARRLQASPRQRHFLFLAATAISVVFIGYHFGTFDQAIHIPFLKKYADAALYPGDAFLDLRLQHYSFFWLLFLPFYRAGILEVTLFCVHVAATYGTFWAVWNLSDTLFHNPLASLIATIAGIFPHMGFSALPLLEFSLLNRTFVLPWLIVALTLYLRRRYWLAFLLLGVMYNLHALSVNFVLAMVLVDSAREWRSLHWRGLLGGGGLFVLAALPVLLWRRSAGPPDLSLRPEWLAVISSSTFYHMFYFISAYPHVIIVTLAGLSTLGLFVVGRYNGPPQAHDRTTENFMLAVVAVLAVQAVTAYWLPVTTIIQFQVMRAGLFLLLFGYLYFARFLARAYHSGNWHAADWAALTGAFVFAAFPFLPLIVLALRRLVRQARWRQVVTLALAPLVAVITVAVGLYFQLWHPGVYIYPRQTAWYRAQVWAKENTPKDALFIVPPYVWWLYESDWRVFSERSAVATHSELLEAAFAPEYLNGFLPRFEAVAPGTLEHFAGNIYANLRLEAEVYGRLTPQDFAAIGSRFGAAYVVVERPHSCGFAPAYENEQFVICDLRVAASLH